MATISINPSGNTITYAGKQLPQDKKVPQPNINPSNTPNVFIFTDTNGNNILQLPGDVHVVPSVRKVLAKSTVLDALNNSYIINIVERIGREPMELDITFNAWLLSADGSFPQDALNHIYSQIFLPDTVLGVTSTLLNGMLVNQVIIEEMSAMPKRGSTDLNVTIKCIENVPGLTLTPTSSTVQPVQ